MAERSILQGYYRPDFYARDPLSSGVEWAMRKGLEDRLNLRARKVDIFVAAPDSKHRSHLAAARAFFPLHPRSGAWMTSAGSMCNMAKVADAMGRSLVIHQPDGFSQCVHEPVLLDGSFLRHGNIYALVRPWTNFHWIVRYYRRVQNQLCLLSASIGDLSTLL